jgi:Rieske Fe-S protein
VRRIARRSRAGADRHLSWRRCARLAAALLTRRSRLQGDATYLIVKNDGTLADFGLNAVCTHLGCVVPWNKARERRPRALRSLVSAPTLTSCRAATGREQVQVPVPRVAVQR